MTYLATNLQVNRRRSLRGQLICYRLKTRRVSVPSYWLGLSATSSTIERVRKCKVWTRYCWRSLLWKNRHSLIHDLVCGMWSTKFLMMNSAQQISIPKQCSVVVKSLKLDQQERHPACMLPTSPVKSIHSRMKRKLPDGSKVKPFFLTDNPTGKHFQPVSMSSRKLFAFKRCFLTCHNFTESQFHWDTIPKITCSFTIKIFLLVFHFNEQRDAVLYWCEPCVADSCWCYDSCAATDSEAPVPPQLAREPSQSESRGAGTLCGTETHPLGRQSKYESNGCGDWWK